MATTTSEKTFKIGLREYLPQAGAYVKVDGWGTGSLLEPGDNFSPLRLRGRYYALAVRVEITGRVPDKRSRVRVKITFIGDGEPDTHSGGWLYLDPRAEV